METNLRLKLLLEFVWILVTGIICFAVIYPICSKIEHYPFLLENVIFIVVLLTALRHIFLLKYTLIAEKNLIKVVVIFLCIPIGAYIIQAINLFQTSLDNLDDIGWEKLMSGLSKTKQNELFQYIRTEMTLFGTGALLSLFFLVIRMIISVWTYRNKGKV